MGQIITTTDFQYKYDDEPHATRRKEILGLFNHPAPDRLLASQLGEILIGNCVAILSIWQDKINA